MARAALICTCLVCVAHGRPLDIRSSNLEPSRGGMPPAPVLVDKGLFAVELLVKEAVSEAKEINDPRPLEVVHQNLKKFYSDSTLFTSNNIINTDETMMRLHLEILNGCTHLKGWRLRDAESVYHYFQTNKIDVITGLQEVDQRDSLAKGGDARDYAISRIYNDALHYVRFRLKHSNKSVSSNLRVIVDKLAGAELKKALLGPAGGEESQRNEKQ